MFFQRTFSIPKKNKNTETFDNKKTSMSEEQNNFTQKYGIIDDFVTINPLVKPDVFLVKNEQKSNLEINVKNQMQEKTSKGKFDQIKDEFIEWSLLTKFDCFSKIFQTKNFLLKFLWLSLFLIFTSLTAYFLSKNLLDYLNYDTVSKIDIINEKPTEFPALTICNTNPFTTSTAQLLISNITITNYGYDINKFTAQEVLKNFSYVNEMTRMYVSQNSYGDSKRKLLGNPIGIQDCSFNSKPCSSTDFTWYYQYNYGNCLQFNTGANSTIVRTTTTEGQLNGLSLSLTIPNNNNIYPNLEGRGLKLFVHNKTFAPRLSDLINIKAGLATNVAIGKTFSFKTPNPYSECQDLTSFTSEYESALKEANLPYRQYDCFKLCLQQLIIDNCDCYWTRYTNLDSSKLPCLNLTQLYCINDQNNAFEITNECLEECPLECDTVTYDVKTTCLDYPSTTLYNYLANNTAYTQSFLINTGKVFSSTTATSYLISINVFYPFTEYTLITESPKTFIFDLISQIGGSMGMLLGFSMFHLIELVEILLLVLFSFLH